MQSKKSRKLTLLEAVSENEVMISDGATGTYLQSHGLESGGCPEEFNSSNPDIICQMAKDYFDAGSDLVLTNSFGGSKFMQKKYGHEDKVAEFNRLAATHAKSVAGPQNYVLGSVGPTGEFLAPLGDVSEKEMCLAFEEQMVALKEGGADAIIIETMTAIEEISLAIRVAKESTNLPVIATMVFDKGPRGFFTMMGVTPKRAAKELTSVGADIIGTNCGNGIDLMIEIAQQMREATDKPMIVHSNAGIPTVKSGQIIYPETPEYMTERFMQIVELGVNIVGGCCGTGPEHIKSLSKTLRPSP